MASVRKPFQGVGNIIRFNRHFYLLALLFLSALLLLKWWVVPLLLFLIITTSLLVSFYVYDRSDLYQMKWADHPGHKPDSVIINIHAGFDETSVLLRERFRQSSLQVFDFYDPAKHTELSIKRARRAYPPFPGTQRMCTAHIPLEDGQADSIFLTLSAHEIRNAAERADFFTELKRVLKNDGSIFVTEHLRDWPNFLAYNIGFFHFISRASWYKTFEDAGLLVAGEIKSTPFVTTFILTKHGTLS